MRRPTSGEIIFLIGVVLMSVWVWRIGPVPDFTHPAYDHRFDTIPFSSSKSTTAAKGPPPRFAMDDFGNVIATDEKGATLWSFQAATSDRGRQRSFVKTGASEILLTNENGRLYRFSFDGQLLASLKVGDSILGPAESRDGFIIVPAIAEAPVVEKYLAFVDPKTFRVVKREIVPAESGVK